MPPKIVPKKHLKSKDGTKGDDDVPEISVDPVLVVSQDFEDYDSLSNMSSQWVYGSPNIPSSLEPTNDRVMIVSDRDKFKGGDQSQTDMILIPKLDFKKIDKYRQYAKDFAVVKEKTKAKAGDDKEKANEGTVKQPAEEKMEHPKILPPPPIFHSVAPKQLELQASKPIKQTQPSLPALPVIAQTNPSVETSAGNTTNIKPSFLLNISFFVGFGVFTLVSLLDLLAWNQAFAALNLAFGKMVVSLVSSSSILMVVLYPAEQLIFALSVVPGFSIYKIYLGCLNPSGVGTFFLIFLWDSLFKNGIFFGVSALLPKEKWKAQLVTSQRYSQLAELLEKHLLFGILFHFSYFPELVPVVLCSLLTSPNSRWTHLAALNGVTLLQTLLLCLLSQNAGENLISFAGYTSNFSKPFSGILIMILSYLRFLGTFGWFVIVLMKSSQQTPTSSVLPIQASHAPTTSQGNNQSSKMGGLLAKKNRLPNKQQIHQSKEGKNHDESELNMVNK